LLPTCTGCSVGNPLNGASARLGFYAGYDWQFASTWIAGIEADWAWADRRTTLLGSYEPTSLASSNFDDSFAVRVTWDASLRGRLGYLITPSMLVYATGGVAALHVEQVSSCSTLFATIGITNLLGHCTSGSFTPAVISHAGDLVGWTIGGGGETALWDNWFLRAEYRYADYGHFRNSDSRSCLGTLFPGGGFALCNPGQTEVVSTDVHVRTHAASFGLTYKFGAPAVVAKY
jgi:outer membrane immunogenic protein